GPRGREHHHPGEKTDQGQAIDPHGLDYARARPRADRVAGDPPGQPLSLLPGKPGNAEQDEARRPHGGHEGRSPRPLQADAGRLEMGASWGTALSAPVPARTSTSALSTTSSATNPRSSVGGIATSSPRSCGRLSRACSGGPDRRQQEKGFTARQV